MNKTIMMAVLMGLTGGAHAADFGDLAVTASELKASAAAADFAGVAKDYVAGNTSLINPIEWVTINGGKFTMGTNSGETEFKDAQAVHEVAVRTFEMSKTAVTVEQYAECVDKGACRKPGTGDYCNWGVAGRQQHPVNCVNWYQAKQYAKFKGARLPSESEWEYAAKSGGRDQKYPWGNEEATCDRAVIYGNGGYGCGERSTWPVCSKPAGNTAQGLCDMVGNVWQWVQDNYQASGSYEGAPADGSAYESEASFNRVMRGGSFGYDYSRSLRVERRGHEFPGIGQGSDAERARAEKRYSVPPSYYYSVGFRLAR